MLLKPAFGLCALLVFIVPFVSAGDDVSTTTEPLHPFTSDFPSHSKEEFIELLPQMNNLRRKFAKDHNIANMNELSWDKSISYDVEEQELSDLKNLRPTVSAYFPKEILSNAEEKAKRFQNKTLSRDDKADLILDGGAILYPSFEDIGCSSSYYHLEIRHAACIFSPRKSMNISGFDNIGEPGSKCSDGFVNNDGLCSILVPKIVSSVWPSEFNTKEEFLELLSKINNLRRRFAKDHDLANMHELIWDEKLENDVREHNSTELDAIHFSEYSHNIEKLFFSIKQSFYYFPKRTLSPSQINRFGITRFLNPLFKNVGCAPCSRYGDFYPTCAFPKRPFGVSDFKTAGEPGSKCSDGYVNNDGLCSPKNQKPHRKD